MKISELRRRVRKDRPMTSVTLRIPDDVVDDLKRIAPLLGFSGYQPLIRAYIGQGLRRDLERLEGPLDVDRLVKSLRRRGVSEKVIRSAVEDLEDDLTTRSARTRPQAGTGERDG
jgi:hypothetical protein